MLRWVLLILGVLPISAIGTTLPVCSDCEFKSLDAAVSAARDIDTLVVRAGVYPTSNVIIEKPLVILGEEGAVLDGEEQTILYLHADRISVINLTLQNVATNYVEDRAAIKCNNSDHVRIEKVKIRSSFFGILMEKSAHGVIRDCVIIGDATEDSYLESSNGNAIHLWYCQDMLIERNSVQRHRDGIYFEFVERSKIRENLSQFNMRYGLHFMFSHENTYSNNTFSRNGAGVAVMYSDHVEMTQNTFLDNWGSSAYGLLLKDITDSKLTSNVFHGNTIAISADNSSRIEIRGNRFEENGYALRVMGNCADNVIQANDFVANSFDVTTNSSTNLNQFHGNYWEEYTGYDLNRDGVGDVPFRPVKLFTYIIAQSPASIILMRSSFIDLLNLAEKVTPVITPETLIDHRPSMRPFNDHLNLHT